MSPELVVAIIGGAVAVLGFALVVLRKVPKRLKAGKFVNKWRELQKLCAQKETWGAAITQADDLLDESLKKRKKTGKTMGERLVNAEDAFSNKDAVWQAHKLANHVRHSGDTPKLKETDVKNALIAFRQALRDMGAIK